MYQKKLEKFDILKISSWRI